MSLSSFLSALTEASTLTFRNAFILCQSSLSLSLSVSLSSLSLCMNAFKGERIFIGIRLSALNAFMDFESELSNENFKPQNLENRSI